MKLNLGCGKAHLPGYVNVDFLGGEVTAAATHLPFRDGSFDEILASHVLEHIPDLTGAMTEIHRVLRPGGFLEVVVPYGLKGLYGASHVHAFDLNTTLQAFCHDDDGYTNLQAPSLFRMVSREVTNYRVLFKWHLEKHLSRRLPWVPMLPRRNRQGRIVTKLPLGPRWEATFRMIKRVE